MWQIWIPNCQKYEQSRLSKAAKTLKAKSFSIYKP